MNSSRRALAFIGIAVLLHLALTWMYVRTVGRHHRAVVLDMEFLERSEDVDVLVAGDSHARNAIDARMLPNALNIAVGGEHYVKTLHRLRWLLSQAEFRVGAVVLNLESTSFTSWKSDQYAPEYVWGRYIDFWSLGLRKRQPFPYATRSLKARVVPYAGELESFVQYATQAQAFRAQPGMARLDLAPPTLRTNLANQTAARHFRGQDIHDPSLVWAFRSILLMLEKRGIRVILVSYPVTESYACMAHRFGARGWVRDRMVNEVRADADLTYLDFEDLYFDRFDVFLDADHLNPIGRAHFTQLLHEELTALGVFGPRRRRGPPPRERRSPTKPF